MNLLDRIALFAVVIGVYLLGAWRGRRRGQREERERVEGLCYSAIQDHGRMSPSLRWVLNAVSSGAHELPTEEGFFAPETKS